MTEVELDEDGRPATALDGNEIQTLLGFLDYQRATVDRKCRGLSDEQLCISLHPTARAAL